MERGRDAVAGVEELSADAAKALLDVLAGDFNVCPADIDVYDPAGWEAWRGA